MSIPSHFGPRLLRHLTLLLLGLWCLLGAHSTLQDIRSPEVGWNFARPESMRGVVGLPRSGAYDVTVVRDLLGRYARNDQRAWLLVYPETVDPVTIMYLRAQLNYWEYPRPVHVAAIGMRLPPLTTYAGVITPPGLYMGGLGEPLVPESGFRIYRMPQ